MMIKRRLYLIGINIALIVTVNVIMMILQQVFGVQLAPSSYQGLLVFSFVLGFGGALMNLWLSRWTAKRLYGVQLVDESVSDPKLQLVYHTVQEIAYREKITMPEVGYYESGEVNAFATGASKNSSLVAVSSGLVEMMTPDEIQGVVGHEMAHILNGDMVTSTLLQGSLNAFTIFAARVLGRVIDAAISKDDDSQGGIGYYVIVNILDIVFGILAGMVLMAHSRKREFKADEGGARYTSKAKMIAGLKKLMQIYDNPVPRDGFATMKFSGRQALGALFASHPPLEKRIQALESNLSL